MNNYTLIMTRTPLREVNFGKKNGRWGKMIVVKGGKVLSGKFTDMVDLGLANMMPQSFAPVAGIAALANFASAVVHHGLGETVVRLGHKGLSLETLGGGVEVVAEFETLERFRTDKNKNKYFVQLKPRPIKPYGLKMEFNKKVYETFKRELNDDSKGECFRVTGHDTKNGNKVTAGILVHEAPQPGFLIGCIAPRKKDDWYIGNNRGGAWNQPMKDIFSLMGGFKKGKTADLLVMDW